MAVVIVQPDAVEGKFPKRGAKGVLVAVQHLIEAVAQHRLSEASRHALEPVEFLRRALRWRTRECLELDLRREIEAAADRAQRIGEALLFPAVGLASLLVEEIQCGGESAGKPVQLLGGLLHLFLLRRRHGAHMGGKM